jgi:allantoinase
MLSDSSRHRWFHHGHRAQLRGALPHVARTGLPLLVHAELPGPIDAATEKLARADWKRYATYLQSRPDEAELAAIRLLLALCREYGFRLHIVHLSTSQALARTTGGARRRPFRQRRNLSALSASGR